LIVLLAAVGARWMMHQQLLVFGAAATDDLLLRIMRLLVLVLFWILTCTCKAENAPMDTTSKL
jgi:putative Ca2+/H+ antiporter (TMEM165/GDT1 family)